MAKDTDDQRRALRAESADAIEAYIAQLERERRDPDYYESGWLLRAIAWYIDGKFMEATLDVDRAQKPLSLRTPEDNVDLPERYQTLTTSEFRSSWNERKG